MIVIETINILLLDADETSAELRLMQCKSAGLTIKAKLVKTRLGFSQHLDEPWDLCIMADNLPDLDLERVMFLLNTKQKELPVLLLCADPVQHIANQYFMQGASITVVGYNDKYFVGWVKRIIREVQLMRRFRHSEFALHDAERLTDYLLNTSKEAIGFIYENDLIAANRAFCALFGYARFEEIRGIDVIELISTNDNGVFDTYMKKFQYSNEIMEQHHFQAKRKEGSVFNADFLLAKTIFHGKHCVQLSVALQQMIPAAQHKQQAIIHHDLLTGLLNRQSFANFVEDLLTIISYTKRSGALLLIRIDEWSLLVKQLGVILGDLLLTEVTKRMIEVSDPEQNSLGRYDENTFAVLMTTSTVRAAYEKAEQIHRYLTKTPYMLNDNEISVVLHIGLVAISDSVPSVQEAFARGHEACRTAKELARPVAIYFSEELPHKEIINQNILVHLQEALDKGDFELSYQPMASLHGENKSFYQVQVRMIDEEGQYILPQDFLPTANHAGLLNKLDKWIINHAVHALITQRLAGIQSHLFIMLSRSALTDTTFLVWLSKLFREARLPKDAVIFEMRESDIAANFAHVRLLLDGLYELHCKTCISHFGFGLNSLQLLMQTHADYVRLDPLFLSEVTENNPGSRENFNHIVKAIQAQGRMVIVPLVENADQLPFLWQSGVNYVQGYFISPPQPAMTYTQAD